MPKETDIEYLLAVAEMKHIEMRNRWRELDRERKIKREMTKRAQLHAAIAQLMQTGLSAG